MQRFISDLKKYNKYIQYATKARLRSEVDGFHLGWIWWILEPVLSMLIYMFVYTVVFKRTTQYLVAFIFTGISLWRFFNGVVTGSVTLIKRNRNIISKVYLPKFTLVIIKLLVDGVKLAFSFLVVIGLMFFYGITPSIGMLQIIPILLLLAFLTFALSCLVMHIGVYFEDVSNFIQPFFRLLFYASGIFYPLSTLGDEAAQMMSWINPAALLINEARNVLLYNIPCNWIAIGLWTVISVVIAAWSLSMIYRSENQYVKLV